MADQPKGPGKGENWGSRIGVILAVMGSAVGLGNFLRFPGLAAKYEGGAFMIPYFIALLLLGLPVAWLEWAIGRYGGARGYNSAPGIYRIIWKNKIAPYFGILGMLVPVGIYMYYIVIEGWCLGYAWSTAVGNLSLGTADKTPYVNFFNQYVGATGDGTAVHGGITLPLVMVAICILLNFILIYRGLTKGIEWFCLWAMPALVICALIVMARVLTLGTPDPAKPELNVLNGLGFMWNLHGETFGFWESLANGKMWLEAAGQIFFTLSVGFGVIINYASYVKKDDDIALSALTSAAGNEFCEVCLGGLMTVPAAFVFLGATGAAASTFDLGFKTLPMVFASMPLGRFVGTIFFTLLFIAALTSSLSMLQPAIALLEEGLGLGRKASVAVLGFITTIGTAFVFYFSGGLTALDTFDFWVGTLGILALATFQVILFGWVMGVDKGMAEIDRGAEIRLPRVLGFVLKYVTPTYLFILFGFFLWDQIRAKPENNYFYALTHKPMVAISVVFIAVVAALFGMLIAASVRRWRKLETAQEGASL